MIQGCPVECGWGSLPALHMSHASWVMHCAAQAPAATYQRITTMLCGPPATLHSAKPPETTTSPTMLHGVPSLVKNSWWQAPSALSAWPHCSTPPPGKLEDEGGRWRGSSETPVWAAEAMGRAAPRWGAKGLQVHTSMGCQVDSPALPFGRLLFYGPFQGFISNSFSLSLFPLLSFPLPNFCLPPQTLNMPFALDTLLSPWKSLFR